jgi:multisubunit Na+/H+ antiporter MnhG subunit
MNARVLAVEVLLGIAVLCCWAGVLGMVRMREAMQALHYLAAPAAVGTACVSLAAFVQLGWSGSSLKIALIAVIFTASGAVCTHAVARAFWQRDRVHAATAKRAISGAEA